MANLAFTKLGLKKNQDIKTVEHNEQVIEVKQYLPINDKLDLIGRVLTESYDDNSFANPVKLEVFTKLYIIKYYTNITFTEKQMEDTPKIYDLLVSNGVVDKILEAVPNEEYIMLFDAIKETAESVYKYRNSVMGVLEAVSADYNGMNLDVAKFQEEIAKGEGLAFVKDILTKLN